MASASQPASQPLASDRPWVAVDDFFFPGGWRDPPESEPRAHWYCEQLEAGAILFFAAPPFQLTEDDRQFLLGQRWAEKKLHKNVSYRPAQDLLRGFGGDSAVRSRLHDIMRNYSEEVFHFLTRFLLPYAGRWVRDTASFRPLEEEGRALPLHKRNDLLHVDAFPSRPTHGRRILRVFTNLHPTRPRVWLTAERFGELAARYAFDAGLPRMATGGSLLRRQVLRLGRALHLPGADRSAYDRFMLRFHDWLKESAAFQAACAKTRLEFPPLSTWVVMTDAVPHAALSGQFALEYTALVPTEAWVAPEHAPIRVLEALCGRRLAG